MPLVAFLQLNCEVNYKIKFWGDKWINFSVKKNSEKCVNIFLVFITKMIFLYKFLGGLVLKAFLVTVNEKLVH